MNHKIIKIILFCCLAQNPIVDFAQQNTLSSGGNASGVTGSFSYSVGQINYANTVGISGSLNQGLQHPYEIHLLHLKAFLQGYYLGGSTMEDVLYKQGEYANPTLFTDSITIALHDDNPPYAMMFETKIVLNQSGNASIKGLGILGESNYIVIKHRNSVETWSASPVLISANSTYDFSTSASKAYGDNQVEVEPGIWAIYTGDINQDGSVDALDYLDLDPDIQNGSGGYVHTDLNGDGSVDALDYLLLDPNIISGVGAATP